MRMGELRVNVKRGELIEKLKENLKKHGVQYVQAMAGWRDAVAAEAKSLMERAQTGQEDGPLKEIIELQYAPQSYIQTYERTIGMLEMAQDETIELGEFDYACFINDEWEWKEKWLVSNTSYLDRTIRRR